MIYGNLPQDLGLVDLAPTEMMFWMYCPISLPGGYEWALPGNLKQFQPLLTKAYWDDTQRWYDSYVYLTAKTLWVHGGYIGNRPGWHADGFGTDDVNYVWSDRAPTDFLNIKGGIELSEDCDESMRQMHCYGLRPGMYGGSIVTFPDKHLLRLDPSVIHRSPVEFEDGMRTFVKISISKDRYNLIGNSENHSLRESRGGPMAERSLERNHPISAHLPS